MIYQPKVVCLFFALPSLVPPTLWTSNIFPSHSLDFLPLPIHVPLTTYQLSLHASATSPTTSVALLCSSFHQYLVLLLQLLNGSPISCSTTTFWLLHLASKLTLLSLEHVFSPRYLLPSTTCSRRFHLRSPPSTSAYAAITSGLKGISSCSAKTIFTQVMVFFNNIPQALFLELLYYS